MRDITKQLKTQLDKNNLFDHFSNLVKTHGNVKAQDYLFEEIPQMYLDIYACLNDAIDSGEMDNIPYGRRNAINTYYKNMVSFKNDPAKVISHISALYDAIYLSNLNIISKTPEEYKEEYQEIKRTRTSYSNLLKDINQVDVNIKKSKELKQQTDKAFDNLTSVLRESETFLSNIKVIKTEIDQQKVKSFGVLNDIKEINTDVESQKLKIDAFSKNINEYKTSIDDLQKQAERILSNEAKINSLIEEANKALEYSSSVGVSAAFSKMYKDANNRNILSGWIGGAIGLIMVAIVITIWIAAGWGIEKENFIASTIGRVIAVGISITGATFCSKQYIRQKNIIEDYAYKSTLSKSIIAFTKTIKESNEKQVAEYLTKVLNEIHQDPLRKRTDEKNDTSINMDNLGVLEKLSKAISPMIKSN